MSPEGWLMTSVQPGVFYSLTDITLLTPPGKHKPKKIKTTKEGTILDSGLNTPI